MAPAKTTKTVRPPRPMQPGTIWEFVNLTTGTRQEYELEGGDPGSGTPYRLRNLETRELAQVLSSALHRPNPAVSHWRCVR